MVTTWIITRRTLPPWSTISTFATRSTSVTRPVAVRRRATSPSMAAHRVAKLVLISAVPPIMVKTAANPGGLPIEVFDGIRKDLASNRAQYYLDFASGPFYGYNRPGAKPLQGVIENWWRQSMMGGAKAHYDGIKAFSETDFTADLKSINVPTLVMHGDDDQIVPIADSAPLSAKLLKNSTLKIYERFPHGMCTRHADVDQPGPSRLRRGRSPHEAKAQRVSGEIAGHPGRHSPTEVAMIDTRTAPYAALLLRVSLGLMLVPTGSC